MECKENRVYRALENGAFHPVRAIDRKCFIQMHMEDNLRSGMRPEEARRIALIKLGGVDHVKEEYRDKRGIRKLRDELTRHLGQVRRGARITITDRGQPVAMLSPYTDDSRSERAERG